MPIVETPPTRVPTMIQETPLEVRAFSPTEKSAAVRILADFFTVSSDIRAKVMINVN